MSILDSLLRLVDPIAHRERQEERRRKQKVQPPGSDDDADEVVVPSDRPGAARARLVCRICGYVGGPDHPWCPRCLAQTMHRQREK